MKQNPMIEIFQKSESDFLKEMAGIEKEFKGRIEAILDSCNHQLKQLSDAQSRLILILSGPGSENINRIEGILAAVARHFGIPPRDIIGRHRQLKLAQARCCFYYCARMVGHSYPSIGAFLGNRNHGTVMSGEKSFLCDFETDAKFAEFVKPLIDRFPKPEKQNPAK